MRPSLLDPLFAPAGTLPGIGPKNAKLFDRLLDKPEGARVLDVLFHLPHATLDRRSRPKIRDAVPGTIVTIEAKVDGASRAAKRPLPRAVQGSGRGRHRRRRARVLSRQSRLGALAAAGRRDALDFRQARTVGRPPADRPSRPGDGRGGTGQAAVGRAGLWPHRRPLSAHRRARRRRRAEAPAAPAGMDRRRDASQARAAGLRRGARRDASAVGARGHRPGRPRRDAPRLRRASRQPARPSSGARAHARRSPAAPMSPRARFAAASRPPCRFR